MLSNINVDKHQFLQTVLVGQPQLKETLAARTVAVRATGLLGFPSQALGRDEVGEYIGFRLSAAGSLVHLFTHEACLLARTPVTAFRA